MLPTYRGGIAEPFGDIFYDLCKRFFDSLSQVQGGHSSKASSAATDPAQVRKSLAVKSAPLIWRK